MFNEVAQNIIEILFLIIILRYQGNLLDASAFSMSYLLSH